MKKCKCMKCKGKKAAQWLIINMDNTTSDVCTAEMLVIVRGFHDRIRSIFKMTN
jgi:hypothetical protein